MTCTQNTHHFRDFKLLLADWFKFSLIEELTCEIGADFKKNFRLMMRWDQFMPRLQCSNFG
jgi:hypothetical protein